MSRLLKNGKEYRDKLISKNHFTQNDNYDIGHSRAQSDGDEHGKGEKDGSIGSATDIAKRGELMTKNIYTKNNEYDISNA